MNHAEFVGHLGQVLPELGHPVPGISDLSQRPRGFKQVATLCELDLAFRKGKRFAVEFLELGFVIKKIYMGGASVHEEENDPACPGGKQRLRSEGTRPLRLLCQKGVQG